MSKPLLILLYLLSITPSLTENIKHFHIDCGRRYFRMIQIMDQMDVMEENGYNYIELAMGNDGMRFLLDDMTLEVGNVTYDSESVKEAIREGNREYYDFGNNEWLQADMDFFIEYAKNHSLKIIPLINTPGHMDTILYAAEKLTKQSLSYKGSVRTIDVTNPLAVEFTQKLLAKYIKYFQVKRTQFFNIGCDEYANDVYSSGFGELIKEKKYGYLLKYINEIADMVINASMQPIMFNDPIYYDNIIEDECEGVKYTINPNIIAAYWTSGWSGYKIAKASLLAEHGFKILNTNGAWYYILGKELNKRNLMNIKCNDVAGSGKMDVVGCMICTWCDDPGVPYLGEEVDNVHAQIEIFGLANMCPNKFLIE